MGVNIRSEVLKFAEDMERKLQRNSYKNGWDAVEYDYLLKRLKEEVEELEKSLDGSCYNPVQNIINECVDVANFAMMIADNLRDGIKGNKGV